jgi:catechol 2,3-dioxygenase-like lactoylglutathione lyase family enzyme
MNQRIGQISLLVNDYDEAIEFYTRKLGFNLVEDTTLSPEKRWVVVSPKGSDSCNLLLAKASNEEQISRIGNQTGGRVFLFLYTDNFERDYSNLIEKGVKIIGEPRHEAYGSVLVFEDLYGNKWDMIETKK